MSILTKEVAATDLHESLNGAEDRFRQEKEAIAAQTKERTQVVEARLRQLERERALLDNLQARL
jgi:hypothetical protein